MRALLISAAILALSAPAFAETKSYDFAGFKRIEAGAAFEIQFTQSPRYSVEVDSRENNLDKIIVEKKGDTLRISRPEHTRLNHRVHDIVRISAPDLDAIDLDAAVKFSADSLNVDKLDIDLVAATQVDIRNLKADTVGVRIEAASKLMLAGECGKLTIAIDAASSVKAADLKCREATVSAGTASSVQVYASDKATAEAGTASKITVSGRPRDFQKKAEFAASVSLAD